MFCYRLLLSSIVVLPLITSISFATEVNISNTLETLDFDNSPKKRNAIRNTLVVNVKKDQAQYRMAYEKMAAKTFRSTLKEDFDIEQLHLGYHRQLSPKTSINAGIINIQDNIAPTDDTIVYNVGFSHKQFEFNQYFSDYKTFNTYQTDLKIKGKKKIGNIAVNHALIAKYIRLDGKENTAYTRRAEDNYLAAGVMLNAKYQDYLLGFNVLWGERVFTVMKKGMKVQHHSQEFSESYVISLGKRLNKKTSIALKQSYLQGTLLSASAPEIETHSTMLQLNYKF